MMRALPSFLFSLFLGLGMCESAWAGDATLAEQLFQEGRALLKDKKFDEACPKLAESLRQDEATGTLLALALCHEGAGRLATAWSTYTHAATRAKHQGEDERRDAALRRAAALEPRLSRLTLVVPPDVASMRGFLLKHDGVPLEPARWGDPFPLDGGTHVIEASASEHRTWKVEITLAGEGGTATVTVPMLDPAAPPQSEPVPSRQAPPRAPAAPAIAPAPASSTAFHDPGDDRTRWVTYWIAGASVVTLGAGTAFGVDAKLKNDASNRDGHCDARGCDERGRHLRHQALSSARLSTALFLAGGVLAAGGAALYVFGSEASTPEQARVRISPAASDRSLGVVFSGAL